MKNANSKLFFARFNCRDHLFWLLLLFSLLLINALSEQFVLNNDWRQGFHHPLQGWDHLLTMIAVGMWAAQLRGHAVWMLPLTFVTIMSLGGLAGVASVAVPNVESMILFSGCLFTFFVFRKVQFTRSINILIVGFFAYFHGYAHGQEISASASLVSYSFGFVFATLLLHGFGIATTRLGALVFALLIGGNSQAQEPEAIQKENSHSRLKSRPIADKRMALDKTETIKRKTVELPGMIVTEGGRAKNLIGMTDSASQGEVSQAQFEYRPLSRVGEVTEVVPGAIATQHSGSGKANQYFLRGYNLDHGTDFTTYFDGIPMNMPTHAHGQGYMDLNSVIPELIDRIEYGKGPYYAQLGDFSSAGYAKIFTIDELPQGILKFTGGQYDYYRALIANSSQIHEGNLLYAGELKFYNGVWQQPENSKKFNGMIRYSVNKDNWRLAFDAKAYTNSWTATNQIPQSAIDSGVLGLYGTMDPTDGGDTNRYSFSTNFWNQGDQWENNANIYLVYYDLNLYSNFTGFLENPVDGDQIHQFEHRVQVGSNLEHKRYEEWFGFDVENTVGLQIRHDEIKGLGLDRTVDRQTLSTVSHSDVSETMVGAYLSNRTYWHEKLRTISGLRVDFIDNDVTVLDTATHSPSVNAANSGDRNQVIVSPKLSIAIGPWYDTEYFVNFGFGYHSNDARGTTLQFDPNTGEKLPPNVARIAPFARSLGGEVGFRSNFIPELNSTLALWWLESSQELVFTGDAGTTEVNGKSRRYGLEWTNYYQPVEWLTLDADLALTSARFVAVPDGETNTYIPNSVGRVISAGATLVAPNGLFGTIRLRHFGDVPLDPSGTFWAGNTSIVNLGVGYQQKSLKLEIDFFNIFDSISSDIAYAYEYAFPAGTASQTGILRHPVEPRMMRATFILNF